MFFVIACLKPCPAQNIGADIDRLTAKILQVHDSTDTEHYLQWLMKKGREYESQGALPLACCCFYNYFGKIQLETIVNFGISSQSSRSAYWENIKEDCKEIQRISLKYSDDTPPFALLAYECELFSKSRLLNSSAEIRRNVMETGDRELITRWNDILELQNMIRFVHATIREFDTNSETTALKRLADTIPAPALKAELEKVYRLGEKLDSLERFLNDQERRLVHMGISNYDWNMGGDLDKGWDSIRDALSVDEALVEYFTHTTANGEIRYGAFVSLSGERFPRVVDIGDESAIEEHMKECLDFEALHSLLWQPVEGLLKGVRNIHIVPAGALHAVPFAALRNRDEYLADRYTLHNLLSGKHLINRPKSPMQFSAKTALLVGGADFDSVLSPDTTGTEGQGIYVDTALVYSSIRSLRGQGFGYLPGSLQEVKTISKILSAEGWSVATLADTHASEQNFYHNVKKESQEIIHISSHGFSLPVPVQNDEGKRTIFRISDDPLLRCGLLFSGANRVWNAQYEPEPCEDGVLTGQEIAAMDLSGTCLAVLSACETGLGAIDNSEGVYGLQRSFRLAGVQAMLVSLWKVPDKETSQLMTAFYTHLARGLSPKQAFDTVQKEARRRNPGKPHLWAGFVFIE